MQRSSHAVFFLATFGNPTAAEVDVICSKGGNTGGLCKQGRNFVQVWGQSLLLVALPEAGAPQFQSPADGHVVSEQYVEPGVMIKWHLGGIFSRAADGEGS